MRPEKLLFIVLVLLFASLVLQAAVGTDPPLPDEPHLSGFSSPTHGTVEQDLPDAFSDDRLTFGAGSNPTGSPIGGGDGYQNITTINAGANYTVMATDELLAALRDADSGDMIFIDEKAQIDLADAPGGVIIPGGVTIAGNRGERKTAGSAVYSFVIEEPGEYTFWGLGSAGGEDNGSFWVSVDSDEFQQWEIGAGFDWNWSRMGCHHLSGGWHTLTLQWCKEDTRLDAILVTAGDCSRGTAPDDRGTGVHIWMEGESAMLSPPMEVVPDSAASGGAYILIPPDSGTGDYPVSRGGQIFMDSANSDYGYAVGLIIGGEDVRITGLCIEGPHKTTDLVSPTTIGIISLYRNLEVDNCEIFGWSNAAIGLIGTGGSNMKTGGYIHHNYIHHNQNVGLGYGVSVASGAVALAEANYFDYCRHAIAGGGSAGDGYEARYNICGQNWFGISPHNFDMHGKPNPSGSGTIAGDTIRIHHNTFLGTTSDMPTCIAIRGVPRDGAYIDHNWFYFTRDAPVWQTGGRENVSVTDNLIGEDGDLSASGPIKYY